MSIWTELRRDDYDRLGWLDQLLSGTDPRPFSEQIEENYAHGGGWRPFGKNEWKFDPVEHTLKYPGDPVFKPYWSLTENANGQTLFVYQSGIVCVVDTNGRFEVTRMD